MTSAPEATWSVIILSGGTGRRLGGADKALLPLAGVSALDRLLAALPEDVPVVVAGPPVPTSRPVRFQGEQPEGGGPVAGIAAALTFVSTPITAVVAVDMPWAASILLVLLPELAGTDADAVVPADAAGRAQHLCAVWRTESLRRAAAALPEVRNAPVRALLSHALVRESPISADRADDLLDIDDEAGLATARRRAEASTLAEAEE